MKKLFFVLISLLPICVFAQQITCPKSPYISVALMQNSPAWVAACMSGVHMDLKINARHKQTEWEITPSNPFAQRVCKIFLDPNTFHFGHPYVTDDANAILIRTTKTGAKTDQLNCLYIAKHGAWLKLSYKYTPQIVTLDHPKDWHQRDFELACTGKKNKDCQIKVEGQQAAG